MNVARPTKRKRLELVLTFLVGLIGGICLSQLLQRARLESYYGSGGAVVGESELRASTNVFARDCPSSGGVGVVNTTVGKPTKAQKQTPLAERLFNETRVLCMVLTSPKTHLTKALAVKRTWGTRCNKLIFMSTALEKQLDTVALDVKEGYKFLWGKTREGLRYVYEHYYKDYDWFLKADDDTYMVMENLRAFLYSYTPKAPVYFGSKFKQHVKQGYMSGGAGYVLSKEALRRFMLQAYGNKTICSNRNYGPEDVEIGRCLQNVGVVAGDTRDENGLARFFPLSPLHSFLAQPSWYKPYVYYKLPKNHTTCCSNYAISFHYSHPSEFYVYDYVIYRLRPFGLIVPPEELPQKKNVLDILQKWRRTKSDNTDKL